MVLQSVLYPRRTKSGKLISLEKAKEWIKQNGYKLTFKGKKVHITDKYYRFRQNEPLTEKKKKEGWDYATDVLKNGVQLIWMYPNPSL